MTGAISVRPVRGAAWVRLFVFSAVVFAFLPSPAARAEDCDCERFRDWRHVSSLITDVSDVGLRALDNTTAPLRESPAAIALREQRLRAIELMPERCRRELFVSDPARVRIVVQATLSTETNEPFSASGAAADRLLGGYRAIVGSVSVSCTQPAGDASDADKQAYTACMDREGPRAYAGFRRLLSSSSNDDLAAWLQARGMDNATAGEAAMVRVYNDILNSGSQANALAYVRAHKNDLTEDQWLGIGQMMGRRFDENYDNARNSAGAGAQGVVSFDQLLRAAQNGEAVRFYGDPHSSGSPIYAGVCRDIASAQAMVLSETGKFQQVFVVSNAHIGGTYHVTTVAESREHPERVYRLNYGDRTDRQAGDPNALMTDARDVSYIYRIALPGGRVVGTTESEFGRFLRRAAGGDNRDVDPFARSRGTMAAANFSLARDGSTVGRVGYGTDGNGAQYMFTGVTQQWGTHDSILPGSLSLTIGNQRLSADRIGTLSDRELIFAYLQIDQHVRPTADLGHGVRFTSDTSVHASGLLGLGGNPDTGSGPGSAEVSVQGDLRIRQEFRVDHPIGPRVDMTYRVGAQISPALTDIRDNSLQVPIVALDYAYLSAEARVNLGDAQLVASALVAGHDQFGFRGRAEVGLVTPYVGASIGAEGRLGESAAPFLEGWGRRVYGNIAIAPHEQVRLNAQVFGMVDRDLPPGGGATMGLSGSF